MQIGPYVVIQSTHCGKNCRYPRQSCPIQAPCEATNTDVNEALLKGYVLGMISVLCAWGLSKFLSPEEEEEEESAHYQKMPDPQI